MSAPSAYAFGMIFRCLSVALLGACLFAPRVLAKDGATSERAPKDVQGFWTRDERQLMDLGLKLANVTRKDLSFQKQPIDDPYRLPVVRKALDDPLSMGPTTSRWDEVASTGSLLSAMTHVQLTLFGKTYFTTAPARSFEQAKDLLPDAVRTEWLDLLATVHWAKDSLRRNDVLGEPTPRRLMLEKAFATQLHDSNKPEVDLEDEAFLSMLSDIKRLRISAHGDAIASATGDLVKALKALPASQLPGKTVQVTDLGLSIRIGGTQDDHHETRADVCIDLGGNDRYKQGASANGLEGHTVGVVIDLAGNDLYQSKDAVSCGGALGGVALQWDCAGDDTYRAGHCSLGAGILGVGMFMDEAGDDLYESGDFGQGAGAFGIGVMIDRGGHDRYHVDLYGQGFASTYGVGMLSDLKGNDRYSAGRKHLHSPLYRDRYQALSQGFSIGMRPIASGGVGVLVDVKGNDTYQTDIYGQGSSYWYSLGLLIDSDGHDSYVGTHYCQGTGIHLSAGMLLDRKGNDHYHCVNGIGIGGAHDFAVGFLIDRAGDDHYSGSSGAQGSGLTNSVAMLIDSAGNDGYTAIRGTSQGSARSARNTGGIGLLLDGAGKDKYSESTRNDGMWLAEITGVGIDQAGTSEDANEGNDSRSAKMSKDAARVIVHERGQVERKGKKVWDLDRLWDLVSEWEVGDNSVILPIARDYLFTLGDPVLDRAFNRLATKNSIEFLAIKKIMAHYPKESVTPRLLERLQSDDIQMRKRALSIAGHLKSKEAIPQLTSMVNAGREPMRGVLAALTALKECPASVRDALKSTNELTGVGAATCLAASPSPENIEALTRALDSDTPYLVRTSATLWLGRIGAPACSALSEHIRATDATVISRRNALKALGSSKAAEAIDAIVLCLSDDEPMIRLSALRAAWALADSLESSAGSKLRAAANKAHENDADPLVRRVIAK